MNCIFFTKKVAKMEKTSKCFNIQCMCNAQCAFSTLLFVLMFFFMHCIGKVNLHIKHICSLSTLLQNIANAPMLWGNGKKHRLAQINDAIHHSTLPPPLLSLFQFSIKSSSKYQSVLFKGFYSKVHAISQ